jgi:hypothetical protein
MTISENMPSMDNAKKHNHIPDIQMIHIDVAEGSNRAGISLVEQLDGVTFQILELRSSPFYFECLSLGMIETDRQKHMHAWTL